MKLASPLSGNGICGIQLSISKVRYLFFVSVEESEREHVIQKWLIGPRIPLALEEASFLNLLLLPGCVRVDSGPITVLLPSFGCGVPRFHFLPCFGQK